MRDLDLPLPVVLRRGQGDLAGAAAEFTIAADPEAAAEVVGSVLPPTVYGLDVFSDVVVPDEQLRALRALPDPAARLARRLLEVQARRHGPDRATIGDAGALAAALEPAGMATRRLPVRVGQRGPWVREVAVAVDAPRYRRLFLDALAGGGA